MQKKKEAFFSRGKEARRGTATRVRVPLRPVMEFVEIRPRYFNLSTLQRKHSLVMYVSFIPDAGGRSLSQKVQNVLRST